MMYTGHETDSKRVAVAMSGGVDSSVSAALLVKQGYEVIGFTMQLFDYESGSFKPESARGCCNLDAVLRAELVCHSLNIPHYTLDLQDAFQRFVIDDFVSEYLTGRTPNPCVRCNTYLKWGVLFNKARSLGCSHLATGHYARIEMLDDQLALLRARDPEKDQSYALWGIPYHLLPHTLLPLGSLTKSEVRSIARHLGLKTAETPESQEICFIIDQHYADFLKEKKPDFFETLEPGLLFEEVEGTLKRVGKHPGFPYFTIGQRRGLGGGYSSPRYVLRTDPDYNWVVIGERRQLLKAVFEIDQVNWLISAPVEVLRCQVQIRYGSPTHGAKVTVPSYPLENSSVRIRIELDEPAEAITPGQSAVL
ncbi:MAG: tRNA 2-thiouridine(34) synthase MnmA, partial [bacterium]